MTLIVGTEELSITEETCVDVLRGFWDPLQGCIVNATSPPFMKNDSVLISPIGTKIFPVRVPLDRFGDMTTEGGKWHDMYTFAIR